MGDIDCSDSREKQEAVMKIHRIKVKNFRNFRELDIKLGDQIVIVGENKIGKSNLLHALRLVLDPSLPDSARQLTKTDFWDGLGSTLTREHTIQISVELTEFEENVDLLAVLAEHLIEPEPMTARLTYVFQPKPELEQDPKSDADYDFFTYGGDRPENIMGYDVRRRIPLDVLPALRDAERDLAIWKLSPLKPLLDEAIGNIDRDSLNEIADEVFKATEKVLDVPKVSESVESDNSDDIEDVAHILEDNEQPGKLDNKPIRQVAQRIVSRLESMVGAGQAMETSLGFSPTDPDRLIRAIRLFIDGGKRSIQDASLGSANLLYLVLKAIELEQLAELGLRDHTFLAIEEPEAHLYPHLQRLVYRDFLQPRMHQKNKAEEPSDIHQHQTILLTTHSPHVVSVAPLRSIVILKHSADGTHTIGASTALIDFSSPDEEDIVKRGLESDRVEKDLERYLDVTRGEMLFSKGIILVEGDSEEYLIPAFGRLLGHNFDELGISVCSVSGTNFMPYVRLMSQKGLKIPFAVLTDYDPQDGKPALGINRVIKIIKGIMEHQDFERLSDDDDDDKLLAQAPNLGVFMNNETLEVDLFRANCHNEMCESLIELTTNKNAQLRASDWKNNPGNLDTEWLLKDIKDIGKGRFAQRLASRLTDNCCPNYIREAIEYVVRKCE
jgi:putative ATP-dependent endonuclease of the OLD family